MRKPKLHVKNFFFLFLAGVISAIAVTIFLEPVELYDSGIAGTSMLLGQITPPYLTLSMFLVALNVPLILFGLKREGIIFTVYAVFAVVVYAIAAWVITDVLPIDVATASPLAGHDLFLCALFGGFIAGLGSGLAVRYGGAIDGIEVMAVIFAKKLGLTVGTFMMIYNLILYIVCGIIRQNWTLPLYSIVTYMMALKTIDFIVEGLDRSKSATIITERPDEVCAALREEFACGITTLDAKGYYSGTDKTMVYIVVNRFQIRRMRDVVHTQDPNAYISISEIADIFHKDKRI